MEDSSGSALIFQVKVSHEAKLKELLHRITSLEIKLCSDATKEFVKLLKSDDGGNFLREYVRGSPKCSELLEAWKLRQGKQGMVYIFDLISAILSHREGKYSSRNAESVNVSKDLDKFAKLLVAEYMNDVYKELNSKEPKWQKAALLLLASIVRRGAGLASEVSKCFDFKLGEFARLANSKCRLHRKSEGLLRKSFVGFALSFLEVGKPGLLRWVLQQKEMYSGVLRGLGNDDEETVVFVLSTLRDRVLVEESLVPPGLRSVLFGSATLEQLVDVCGWEGGDDAAELAFSVLVKVCTDPSNGLMPDSKGRPNPLKGNQKRIMDLLKKLRATEVQYHRDLLLAIVNARASFGLSYLTEFPYNIENYKSSSWVSAISVAADLVLAVGNGLHKEFVNSRSNDPHPFDNIDLQNIMKCLFPHPFSRSLFNKGLQHAKSYVQHGTLRLLLELLKLLDSLYGGLNHNSSCSNSFMQHTVSIKQEVLNYVQAFLPDMQVLLNLLSSLDACSEACNSSLKRNASHDENNSNNRKKFKMNTSETDIDIVVGGISSGPDIDLTGNIIAVDGTLRADALDDKETLMNTIAEIWGVDLHSMSISTLKDAESYLLSRVLDALRYFRRTLPFTLDNSFESFKGLLRNPLELTSHLQISLLSLLVEFIEWHPDNEIPIRTPPMLYKYLQPFIKLLMFSPINGTRDLAYRLAMAAMFSTGAFDRNFHEIEAWFLFLPGYDRKPVNILEVDESQSLTLFIISFLCDAVSTLGNNLVKYWNALKNHVNCLEGGKDLSPDFSPFIICVLEKCLKVIQSKSGTCSVPKKSMVLLYTCNTVKYLLQTQVNPELLSALVNADLSDRLGGNYEYDEAFLEWKPLKNLLDFVKSISDQRNCCLFSKSEEFVLFDGSLRSVLGDVDRLLSSQVGHETAETTMELLKQAPFHVIFPAIMCMDGSYISKLSVMQELLLHKLSDSVNDYLLLPTLRLVLFWTHHIQLCCEFNSLEIEKLLNLCVILVGKLLAQLLVPESGSDRCINSSLCSSSHNIQEVIKTIFCHPSVLMSLSSSMGSSQNFANGNVENSFDMLHVLCDKGFHKFGNPILNILTITLDNMWSLYGAHLCESKGQDVANNFVKSFKGLQRKLFLNVRDRFELSISTKNMMPLLPSLYALHALHRFLSPFELLELVDWMFSRVEVDDLPTKKSYLSVGCFLAADAFCALLIYFQQPTVKRVPYDLFWEMGEKSMKADIFEQIYSRVVDFSASFEIDCADRCLVEAVNVLYKHKNMQRETFHPLLFVLWKIITVTPVEMISHCIYKMNAKKAKFLHILTELSSLHSSIFGHLFMGIVNRSSHHGIGAKEHISNLTLSEDQFMLLLPASVSYLSLMYERLGEKNQNDFKHLVYFYSKILLKGFSKWKSFLSKDIFEEDYGEFFPSSLQEFLCLLDCSLLGKSICMLQYHFVLNGESMKMKKRLKLFKSICPKFASQGELLDCDSQLIDSYSLHQSFNIINRVIAKISICRILLFHEEAGVDLKEVVMEMQSKLRASRDRFLNILVDIWELIVKKFSLASDHSGTRNGTNISFLYNHLEVFVLKSILDLAVQMRNDLIQSQSIPFLEQLVRSTFLYRFGDPTTMKTLRLILTQLSEGSLSDDLHLQLLLAHSQFAPTLHSLRKSAGSFLKPVSSILKCLVIPSLDYYKKDMKHMELTTGLSRGAIEIVELLWTLLGTKAHQTGLDSGNDIGINLKDLHALLCHSYGATLSRIDLVIYTLMQQIESMSGSWSQNVKLDSEAVEEWSRRQHGDNFPIDPDLCVSTVLYFPYDRSISDELPSANKIEPDIVRKKIQSSHAEDRECYDPVFVLRFSIHSLSKAYIEPVEFAGYGLLAIAFVSMSSPDLEIRKLAYGTLDKFKNALEKCQKRKDVMGLRLLLNSIQNSIEEPWQRIPSVIALFAAEASCVLLDSSHDHHAAISTLLIHSSKLNMRVIPLFDNFFWSTSVNFKAERVWILRLVYAGLNSDDDAMIYIRNSILENLMSFYVSPLSDAQSKDLIIEVIKKSVKLHKIARHLVKHCSLFSWFSSLISVTRERINVGENKFFLKHLLVVLKVVNDVITSGSISKWLQNYGLEQLMELSSNLFNFLLHDVALANEAVGLVNPFLQMIASMLKLSQKRKIYQPHFTLSIDGLYQLYQAGSMCNQATKNVNPEFALEAILMNAPPDSIFLMNQERLQSFLNWAITTALRSESEQRLRFNESRIIFSNSLREESQKNSIVSKLLRWLTASVITGKLYKISDYMDSRIDEMQNFESLHSLLVHVESTSGRRHDIKVDGEELVASTIFYLQLLLGLNHEGLPSVVAALCLLIFGPCSFTVGRADLLQSYDTFISSHSSRVRCPPEANPAWRWSFYQPWKDHSVELNDSQKMEEYHACLTLLVIVSNVLSGKKLESACLSPLNLEKSGLFQWEISLLKN